MRVFTCVIIIDALKSPAEAGREPGEVVRYEAGDFKGGHRHRCACCIGLGAALELERQVGHETSGEVVVFAIGAQDVKTFGEKLSPPVAAADRVTDPVPQELGA